MQGITFSIVTHWLNFSRPACLFALALGSAIALVACGDPTIKTNLVESSISKQFEQENQVKLESINCPAQIKSKAGEVYECTGRSKGIDLTMEVKPTGEGGNFAWKMTKEEVKELAADVVEARVKAEIEKQASTKLESIKCPQGMKPEKGKVYECKAVAAGASAIVLIKPTGVGGEFVLAIKRSKG
jgi:hypothetical protein